MDRIEINHTLHIEQINGNFYGVPLADLIDRLYVWSINELCDLVLVLLEWISVLFQLLLLLLFVFVHPKDS